MAAKLCGWWEEGVSANGVMVPLPLPFPVPLLFPSETLPLYQTGHKSFQTIPVEIRGEEVSTRWITPEKDWVKVNSDGSSMGNPGRAGCGGVIRDHHGAWIVGYCRDVGWSTAFEAECWGAGEGIEVARKLGFKKNSS
ncbi:uncharacterized protein LOC114756966 [Neltuma alba]|uniref:uncharacterized protein LOC114756966 n=1 Tax=Neltuma alba TaxID=207710 RepID=UPI0010A50D87|nr:uncharacterized protein LOC114756966 [Prosopis alba]